MKYDLKILYEDDQLLSLSKPSGLLSIPDRFNSSFPSVYSILQKRYDQVYTVHRLDKQTSGVMVWARNENAHRELSLQFENRTVQKIYHVLVKGQVPRDEGSIELPIARHPAGDGRMVVHRKGKPSHTNYKILRRYRDYTLVEAEIMTGRTHQIRVHFHAARMPLAVDPTYGKKEGVYLSSFKKKYRPSNDTVERPLIERLTLHAYSIRIAHPLDSKEMAFIAPYPKDFRAVLNQLDKWDKPRI